MSRIMLIDAAHEEETRVAVMNGNRLEELDFESAAKKQLRGNVYLARVTRVEPSLQAAFVEYGGNRHGFLAFSEIHPDYYQIPIEDRKALLEEEEEESLKEAEEDEIGEESEEADKGGSDKTDIDGENAEITEDIIDGEGGESEAEEIIDDADEEVEEEQEKMLGVRRKRLANRRYKIQEVIKRGQILLVQVVKEERGNKGAAMTSYLSLAGRYCVLMPNTPRGGGISRKISNGKDRKRLKKVIGELSLPQGMGLIVRTAGAKRTRAEIKRDYNYLSKLWDTIRDTTLKSIAPSLIHEEGNLVKRSIRDLYGKDIDRVLVQGETAYKTAKNFMKLLMPSHAKNVQHYKDRIPLFLRYQVERQIENCLEPIAQLKSGGYLVIHPTEALVSVDVNSGRSTKERNVERTALKTNLEAAEEVARQMRLRDLAGLVVIDFIDMDRSQNNKAVERKMREVLAKDRARVQMGRISQFGLMELSRQRRRRSLLEGSTSSCEHCSGVGRKRSVASSALKIIRAIEEEAIRGRYERIRVKAPTKVAAYLLNEKRDLLNTIAENTGQFAEIIADNELIRPEFTIEGLIKSESHESDPLEEIATEQKKSGKKTRTGKKTSQSKKAKQKKDKQSEKTTDNSAQDNEDNENNTKPVKRRRESRGGRKRNNKNETANPQTKDKQDAKAKAKPKSTKKKTTAKTGAKTGTKTDKKPEDKNVKEDKSKNIREAKKQQESKIKAGKDRDDNVKTANNKTGKAEPVNNQASQAQETPKPKTEKTKQNSAGEDNSNINSGAEVTNDIKTKTTRPKTGKTRRRGWWQRRK